MTKDELHGYIGVLFILEVTKNRNVDITEIWFPNSMYYSDYPTLTMPGTKFQTISRCITFYNLKTRSREDSKFQKMQHIIFQF